MKKLKILSLILLALSNHVNNISASETSTWYDINGLNFLKTETETGDQFKVIQSDGIKNPAIAIFRNNSTTSPLEVNLKLINNSSVDFNIGIEFGGTKAGQRTANLNLEGNNLTLSSNSSIDMFSMATSSGQMERVLNMFGSGKESLILKGTDFGMKLAGNMLLNLKDINSIQILAKGEKTRGAGISAVAEANWNNKNADKPNTRVEINSIGTFLIEGNVNHAIASFGNNLINVAAKDIELISTVSNNFDEKVISSNGLVYGTGRINLSASSQIKLDGRNQETSDPLYKESYAIRGGAIDCDSCGKPQTRYWHTDFNIAANSGGGIIELNTNWGAIYMEAIEDSQKNAFHANARLLATNINIRASGTSNDGTINAAFKVISDFKTESFDTASEGYEGASIELNTRRNDGKQEGNIVIDYVDSLGKEKKQDIFYAYGQTAKINLDSSYIEINNQYEEGKLGTHADLRNIFFADNASNIALKGKTKIFGNTTARNAATVSLTLERGSEITGAMFDNSYPYYDSTTEAITNFHDNGKVIIKGSQSSVWNVLPYEDSADRGSLFNKDTVRSTVFSIDSDNTTKTNPFIVNLAGSSTAQNSLKSSSAPYQKLNVTNLGENGNGFTQFNLKFDDNKGTSSGQANGHDAVLIHNGQGSHGVYVVYTGDQGSNEAESLRDAWLVQDNSQNASFELTNSGGTVDIGLYKYSLAVEEGQSQIGGNQMANYWYLKRGTSPDKPNPDNPNPDNPVVPPPSDDPFTPGADSLLSFAGSHRYLHWSDLQDLRKRLGEVRYGSQDGAWVRGILQKDLTDGENGASGLKQNYYGINLGADHLVTKDEKGMVLLGASVNLGRAKQKTRGVNNGSGDTDRYGMNGYATWANAEGSYADLVLSADYYRQDISTTANGISQKGKYNTFGLGASIEVGKQFSFESRDLKWGPWYRHTWIEPQLQLSYYWLSGKKYRLSNKGIRVNIKDDDSLIGRAGVVIGTKWNYGDNHYDLNKRYFQAYIKGGVKHDFLGNYKITLNDQIFSKNIGKTTGYYGAGADWQAGSNTRFYLQLEREHGSGYTKEYEVSVGMKYQF